MNFDLEGISMYKGYEKEVRVYVVFGRSFKYCDSTTPVAAEVIRQQI